MAYFFNVLKLFSLGFFIGCGIYSLCGILHVKTILKESPNAYRKRFATKT